MSFTRRTFLMAPGILAAGSSMRGAGGRSRQKSDEEADVTRRLARYVVDSEWEDIPQAARREATRSLLNWVGCALGGARHETVEVALAALSELSGPRVATVLGRPDRLDILHAALLNGVSSHVLDFDDTHLETIIHPAGPVAPALLALAERETMTGAELLHAFVLGIEVECRIGMAVYPSHYDRGYHITGTAGVFGAAAAAGKILGLDEQRMCWALGIAATESAGLREMFGTMCKSLHPGRAAQNGLSAALLASKGFTSSERALEAPRGFAHVLSEKRDFTKITDGLGESFEVTRNTYKPFPCGIVIHPTIDACVQLQNEHEGLAARVQAIELRVHPLVLELTGKKAPSTGLESKFSVYHSAAVALLRGVPGEKEYSDDVVRDPEVIALRERVSARADESVREDEVFARIVLRDGETLEKHVAHAVGSLERPMTNEDLEGKFRGQAEGVLDSGRTDKLIALLWSTESLGDVSEIARASVPA